MSQRYMVKVHISANLHIYNNSNRHRHSQQHSNKTTHPPPVTSSSVVSHLCSPPTRPPVWWLKSRPQYPLLPLHRTDPHHRASQTPHSYLPGCCHHRLTQPTCFADCLVVACPHPITCRRAHCLTLKAIPCHCLV